MNKSEKEKLKTLLARNGVLAVCTKCGFIYYDGPQGQCDCNPRFIKSDPLPAYALAIRDALANGYSVNTKMGIVTGLKGKPLAVKLRGSQNYPTISLVTPNMPRRFYVVPIHKVVAFAVWGKKAFAPGICVRHLNADTCDNRKVNLRLGTYSDNERDKPAKVKSAACKIARAAQPYRSFNAKLTDAQVRKIKSELVFGKGGRVKRGVGKKLAARYHVCISTITNIAKGRHYADV